MASGALGLPITVGDNQGVFESEGESGGLAITPDGETGYVGFSTGNSSDTAITAVAVVDLRKRRVTVALTLSGPPQSIAITPDGSTVYVLSSPRDLSHGAADTVTPIATATNTEMAPIQLPTGTSNRPCGDCSRQLVITPDGTTAYTNELTRIDLATRKVTNSALFLPNGFAIAIAIAIAQVADQERQSRTSVSCAPANPIVGQATTCGDGDRRRHRDARHPSGTVNFAAAPFLHQINPVFTGDPCPLSGEGATASCSVTVYPKSPDLEIIATHPSDGVHLLSGDQLLLRAQPTPTTTSVSCQPADVVVGQSTTCTVTVADAIAGGRPTTPTGDVPVQSSTPGRFSTECGPSPDQRCCALSGSGRIDSCTLTYTPSAVGDGPALITANYDGDVGDHAASSGQATVGVSARSTSTTVACDASTLAVGQTTTCTATVTDTAPGTPRTPRGTVRFVRGDDDSFSGDPCRLADSGAVASCQVTYTPTAVASGSHTITAIYAPAQPHQGSQAQTTVTVTPSGGP